MKFKILLSFILFLLNTSQTIAQLPDRSTLYKQVLPYVVTIYGYLSESHFHNNTPQKIGSGVVLNSEGIVVTNFHVIQGMTFWVIYSGEKKYSTNRIVYADAFNDFVLLKTDYFILNPLHLGDSDELLVGNTIYSVGSPQGLTETLSEGFISGPKRNQNGKQLIQHNSEISPGSSGGALFNAKGELVGINVSVAGNSQNISFAIPINIIKKSLERAVLFNEKDIKKQELIAKAIVATENGNSKELIEYCKKLLEIYPQDLKALYWMGIALKDLGRLSEAETYFQKALQLVDIQNKVEHDFISNLELAIGRLYFSQQQINKAIEHLLNAAQLNQYNLDVYYLLSYSYALIRDIPKACHYADASIAIDPFNPSGYLAKGSCYVLTNDKSKACEFFRIAKEKAITFFKNPLGWSNTLDPLITENCWSK